MATETVEDIQADVFDIVEEVAGVQTDLRMAESCEHIDSLIGNLQSATQALARVQTELSDMLARARSVKAVR